MMVSKNSFLLRYEITYQQIRLGNFTSCPEVAQKKSFSRSLRSLEHTADAEKTLNKDSLCGLVL